MKTLKLMITLCLVSCYISTTAQIVQEPTREKFARRVIASGLSNPWTIIYGPDDYLWITEGNSYEVSRINPVDGKKTVLLNISQQRNYPRYDRMKREESGGKPWPPNGLMGMALHPQLLKGKPYVYVAYIHHFEGADKPGKGCADNDGGCMFKTRIVQYTYNSSQQKLEHPVIICDTIPGSNDHNGGRLLIAPVDGKEYLFYAVGDMGAGQFSNAGRLNRVQQITSYEGKVLRFNILPDEDPGTYNRWIPNNNPFNTAQRQSAVWTTGHRNPQGLAYGVIDGVGRIYSSEHGPYSDDEVNLIERGKNYGHPLVIGYADGNYDGLAAGVSDKTNLPGEWHTSYPFIASEKANARRIGAETYRDPLTTLYPNAASFLQALFQKIRSGGEDSEWPSEAPSSIAVYTHATIPGWRNSLLVPTLKGGKLIRLKLDEKGEKVVGDTINYFKGKERYRAIEIAPKGDRLFLSVDSTNITSGPSKENPQQISCSGCIIEFTWKE
ncbi:PQQ-dependent sugar dehydrogenase [Chitinophaga rhizophila]|uniref:PQQ-dependent sugar dehydrogenase n=1 Tax=Chitinophaga rhizophila TaxID=2866212 RepID=A0ABS7G666_9BACT|nr:PQQ-dependent sugar dehydrogenase [Chitinophaga rhizophila]MBW8683137.1 PQQ-dependent sugar dehydrogenase [Chitinophaga rhizophila]